MPVVGFVIPATSFSAVLLPEPLRPITPKVEPFGTSERHVGERREASRWAAGRDQAALQERALERRELLRRAVAAVNLRDVGELDGVHDRSCQKPVASEPDDWH